MLTLSRLLSLVTMLSVCLVNAIEISSYARVSRNGDSINLQSDTSNKSISNKMSDLESTLIDKQNVATTTTTQQPAKEREAKQMNDKSSGEKSTGRAIQSNYYFPLPQFSKPVQINRYSNQKSGRLIAYPLYSAHNRNSIGPAKMNVQYNRRPPTGQQKAQRRFVYTPDSIYKRQTGKGSGGPQGYQYAKPPTDSAPSPMKFNAPIVVADSQPPSMMSSNMMQSSPPKSSYLPPNMMPPDMPPPQSSYLPPDMMPSPPGSPQFLPTIPPDETPSKNPVTDLLTFPTHVNTSYLPSELDAIKDSINMNPYDVSSTATVTDDPSTYTPPILLYNFPPNIESSYLPPSLKNNGAKSPSGEEDGNPDNGQTSPVYIPPKGLHNFPPNIESSYLPPSVGYPNGLSNSYLPPASGENHEISVGIPSPDVSPYIAPKDLYNFPPNINSAYLPPGMKSNIESPINSYLPPASGHNSDYAPPSGNNPESNDDSNMADDSAPYTPPQNLYNFPPNINANYLPPEMKVTDVPSNSYLPPASGSETGSSAPSYVYNPPSNPQMPPPSVPSSYLPPGMNQVMATGYSYPPPSGSVSGFSDGSKQNFPGPTGMQMDMQTPMQMPPSAPPMDDHDHDHHDHSAPDFSQWHDIMYDDHHHHHHTEPPTTTTTEAPEEPRVKQYSYYYLGRKLWYVPLYFTLWFCLYVAALIIRSIGRHKVDLPNHYVSRSLHDMSHEETVQKINKMTEFAMQQIEDFKEKYL